MTNLEHNFSFLFIRRKKWVKKEFKLVLKLLIIKKPGLTQNRLNKIVGKTCTSLC